MSGRGRRAALPEAGHERAPVLKPGELLVRHVEENGEKSRVYDFGELPGAPALQRELAELFARRVGPDGTWRVLASSQEMWWVLCVFAQFLAAHEPSPSSLSGITPGMWNAWTISRAPTSTGWREMSKVVTFLRGNPKLAAETRELVGKRRGKEKATETAYSPEEFDKIKKQATRVFRAALYRIRENQLHLERWRAGEIAEGSMEWRVGEALDHISRTGDVPTYFGVTSEARFPDGRRVRPVASYTKLLGSANTWQRLFLGSREGAALLVLLVATYGWNVVSAAELRVPERSPDSGLDGQVIWRVELEKRRRHLPFRYETRNLTDWGADSPGRLISQAVEATAPARATLAAAGHPTDQLIVWRSNLLRSPEGTVDQLFSTNRNVKDSMRQYRFHNRRSELGDGLGINFRRLRKTVVALQDRGPSQHTQNTHDEVYVLPDPQTWKNAEPTISDGVAEAVEHAFTTFEAHVSRADTDTALDTATTGCSDYHHSRFTEHGAPCRASFLLCTACPNAVVTPRHLPRLAHLLQVLGDLRGTLPEPVWEQDWKQHHARLLDLRHRPDFTDAEWTDALSNVSTRDQEDIDKLLRKGFDA